MASAAISIFIGSSNELRDVAEVVASVLGSTFECSPWWDAIPPSEFILQALQRARDKHKFSLFIGSADDLLVSRGQVSGTMRGNIVGEFMMFVGANSLDHTYLLLDTSSAPTLPSDLEGLVYTTFSHLEFRQNPAEAVKSGCDRIVRQIFEVFKQDTATKRAVEQAAMTHKRAICLSELAEATFILRDIIDAVQQDTLEALADEDKFSKAKKTAADKINEIWGTYEERATLAGVIAEFIQLKVALLEMVQALPFPKDFYGGIDDARTMYDNSVLAPIPKLIEAVQQKDWKRALEFALQMPGKVTPESLMSEFAEMVDTRLQRLKQNYANWWRRNSKSLRTHLAAFQSSLMRAQTHIAVLSANRTLELLDSE